MSSGGIAAETATGALAAIVRSRWDVSDGAGFAADGETLLTLGGQHLVFLKLP